jgi:hypothetical protein
MGENGRPPTKLDWWIEVGMTQLERAPEGSSKPMELLLGFSVLVLGLLAGEQVKMCYRCKCSY